MADDVNRLTATERYQRDQMFRTVVDYFTVLIEKGDYTPTELREAAILAATLVERRRKPEPRFVPFPRV